ncbi:MAG: outer membrane lipoprotein-sorting protein [Trueperaceae bacterium]|jgi:outer membrane lipoprotein-sorting protein
MPDLTATGPTAARRRPRATLLALLAAVLLISTAAAQRFQTAEEVTDAMADLNAPATSVATMTMTITSASGHTLTREMQLWSANEGKSQLIKFLNPADIRGSGFLSVEEAGTTQTMIYLPALGRTRRVAGGQEQDAFFGSDFSYEEISSMSGDFTDDFDAELLEIRDGPVYVMEATASDGADSNYDRIVFEVPESTLIPSRVEFYRGGELVKVLTISATTEVGGYVLPSQIRMETVAAGSHTTIVQSDFTVDEEIPAEVFTERFLQR